MQQKYCFFLLLLPLVTTRGFTTLEKQLSRQDRRTLLFGINGKGSGTLDEMRAPLFVDETHSKVQQYYGKELQSSSDLKTNACCSGTSGVPKYMRDCMANLHPTTLDKYYGCGLCLPSYDLTDYRILDLGCGAGRDVYIAAQLVGPNGSVVGIDMTPEQLQAAKEQQNYHAQKFGFDNVQFHLGYLESLFEIEALKEAKGTFDLIISNCVINLCTDKQAVLKACYELLKPGGELYFSDVYANRRVPQVLQKDPVLWGECLSGALYWNDFLHMSKNIGFFDPRLVEHSPITISNAKVQETIQRHGPLEFSSATCRLLKIDQLEPACEDYGQAVIYRGTIPRSEAEFRLDQGHIFATGKVHLVCGNTWLMLEKNPKIGPHFTFIGDFSRHFGKFEGCGTPIPFTTSITSKSAENTKGSCC